MGFLALKTTLMKLLNLKYKTESMKTALEN